MRQRQTLDPAAAFDDQPAGQRLLGAPHRRALEE